MAKRVITSLLNPRVRQVLARRIGGGLHQRLLIKRIQTIQ